MKRIAYVLSSSQYGGMEQHTLDLVRGMSTRGFEIWVVCPEGPLVVPFKTAGAQVVIDAPKFDIDPLYIRRLSVFLKTKQIDIVHGHELKAGVNALLAGNIAATPLKIIHVHTPINKWQVSPFKKKLDILIYSFVANRFADYVLALTDSVKEERIREEGIDPRKIVVIPNGINAASFRVGSKLPRDPNRIFVIGALGRFSVEKGFSVLLHGFEQFLKNFKEQPPENWPRLVVGGAGPLNETLKSLTTNLGLARFVTFTGLVLEESKAEFLHELDIYVFPSLAEGFGIALVEAMAAGLPCLSSDLTVLKEVGGDTVEFFKAGDSGDLSVKLYKLWKDATLRNRLGEDAADRATHNFSLETFWQAYQKLYGG